jgi:hypothetical protein
MNVEEMLDGIATMVWKPDPVGTPGLQIQMDALPEWRAMVKVIGSMLELADTMEKDAVWLKYGDEGDRAVAQEIRGEAGQIRRLASYYLDPARMRRENKFLGES